MNSNQELLCSKRRKIAGEIYDDLSLYNGLLAFYRVSFVVDEPILFLSDIGENIELTDG